MTSTAAAMSTLSDETLIEAIQRGTFAFFLDGAHPQSCLAPDRRPVTPGPIDDLVAIGGSGFGIMALLVAVERAWLSRAEALARLERMVTVLEQSQRHHGAWPHFMNAATGASIAFGPQDDGGDLVETSFLCMGMICARQYLSAEQPEEARLRQRLDALWRGVEWDWYTHGRDDCLLWHWSPNVGWAMNHEIRGWNECLITYVLALASPTHPVHPQVYHRGYAHGPHFRNGARYYGIEMPLGMPYGGPLFFTHYSFCGLDPRGLCDRYADYWDLNLRHVRIHQAHAQANPGGYAGVVPAAWGLTASDDPDGYLAHDPSNDNGTISPTAALSSLPYAPQAALAAARHFLQCQGGALWQRYGFVDAYNETRRWTADHFLAIDQGPIVIMMENHRSGLLWRLFMSAPEVLQALTRLEFASPWLPSD